MIVLVLAKPKRMGQYLHELISVVVAACRSDVATWASREAAAASHRRGSTIRGHSLRCYRAYRLKVGEGIIQRVDVDDKCVLRRAVRYHQAIPAQAQT